MSRNEQATTEDWRTQPDYLLLSLKSSSLALYVTLLVVLLSSVVCYILWRRRVRPRTVALMGVCDSGKSLLLSLLAHNVRRHTVTSIVTNSAHYTVNGQKSSLILCDIPGHDRVRVSTWCGVRQSVCAVVLVVDSSTFTQRLKDVAECLYQILVDPSTVGRRLPVLVFCNKQDISTAKGASLIKSQLQKELDTIRWTQTRCLSSTADTVSESSSGRADVCLGQADRSFSFDQLRLSVDFVEGCCGDQHRPAQLESVHEWLRSLV